MGGPPRLIDLSVARTVQDAAKVRAPIGTDELHGARAARAGRSARPARRRLGLAGTLCTALTQNQAAGCRPPAAPHAA